MTKELRTFVLDMKSLDQKIQSPILVGAGDANGRTFRIIFTQEAADMFTPLTKVYLKWYHQTERTRGYNVFQEKKDEEDFLSPQVWELKFPRMMLFEGDVTCSIELVDDISISTSTTFLIHVVADPYDGSDFCATDDFSVFQQAVIDMNSAAEKANKQFEDHEKRFSDMEKDMDECQKKSNKALSLATEAMDRLNDVTTEGLGLYMNEIE